jgi:hypothetical protein
MQNNYTNINSHAIDKWVDSGWKWGKTIDHNMFLKAKEGEWSVLLTPTKPVPKRWFCSFPDANILGLASGEAANKFQYFQHWERRVQYWTIPRSKSKQKEWLQNVRDIMLN